MRRGECIRVAIISADAALCSTLITVLDCTPPLRTVWTHSHLPDGTFEFSKNLPDILLFDETIFAEQPCLAVNAILQWSSTTRILVLGDREERNTILAALRAGASGCVSKNSTMEEICEAIRQAYAGGCPMSPKASRRIAEWFVGKTASPTPSSLSPRERQILSLVADGAENKEIASKLGLAEPTVRAHLRSAFEKLQVRSRSEAVIRFRRGH